MHCLTCGYDLRGLPEPRCPECGRAFDLRGDGAHRERVRRLIHYAVGAFAVAVVSPSVLLIAGAFSSLPMFGSIPPWTNVLVLFAFCMTPGCGLVSMGMSIHALIERLEIARARTIPSDRRGTFVVAMVIAFLVLVAALSVVGFLIWVLTTQR